MKEGYFNIKSDLCICILCGLINISITGCGIINHNHIDTTDKMPSIELQPTEQENGEDCITKSVNASGENKSEYTLDSNDIHDNNLNDLEMLNVNEENPLEYEYDSNEEYITLINGKYSELIVNNPDDALNSLYSVKTLIGLDNPEEQLILHRSLSNKWGRTYTFFQFYNDIQVFGSIITVNSDNTGKVYSLSSSIIDKELISKTLPTLLPKQKENNIKQIIRDKYPEADNVFSSSIIIFPTSVITSAEKYDKPLILAYATYVFSSDQVTVNKLIISDANSGEIIYEYPGDTYSLIFNP